MKTCLAFIALACAARAETYMLTNGVPVTGTVVSSIVAQVVIRTPLGALRQIPLSAFSVGALQDMPHEDANYYATTSRLISQYGVEVAAGQRLKSATEQLLQASEKLRTGNDLLAERVRLWEEASAKKELDDVERIMYVEEAMRVFERRYAGQ